MPSLVRANIFQRKTRAAITVFAVAVEVAAVLVLVGLTQGTLDDVTARMQAIGADLLVQPQGASPILGFGSTTLRTGLGERLREVDGVEEVSPVMIWPITEIGDGAPVNVWGIEPSSFRRVGGRVELLRGRDIESGHELVVDDLLAEANGLDFGQRVEMLAAEWTIVGIYRAGMGGRIFVPLPTLQELVGLPGRANALLVSVVQPDLVGNVARRIESGFEGYQLRFLDSYGQELQEGITGLEQFTAAVSSIAVVLSFLVILLAMYTSIVERTREIGILKALGASKLYIMRAIVSEAVLLCALGAVSGFGLAALARWLLVNRYPTLSVEFTGEWMVYAAVLGVVGGIIGSIYPALRAARQDPVLALRYD